MLKILNSTYYSIVNIDDSLGIGIGFNLGLMHATFLHLVLDKKKNNNKHNYKTDRFLASSC